MVIALNGVLLNPIWVLIAYVFDVFAMRYYKGDCIVVSIPKQQLFVSKSDSVLLYRYVWW